MEIFLHSASFNCLTAGPVFLKVGGIAPLGAMFNSKGAKKANGAIVWAKQRQGGEKAQPVIDHWVNFRSLILWLVSFLQILIYSDNHLRLLLQQFIW